MPVPVTERYAIITPYYKEDRAILKRCIVDPVSPAFMAPPVTRPREQELKIA